jgi:hypothetical protein
MITTWILVWLAAGQQPIVLTGFATEVECRQMVDDVLKHAPKKRKAPARHGWCVPDLGIDTVATEQETTE